MPLSWYPRLEHATDEERSRCELFADGKAIERSDLDEHIGIDGLIAGRQSQESDASLYELPRLGVTGEILYPKQQPDREPESVR